MAACTQTLSGVLLEQDYRGWKVGSGAVFGSGPQQVVAAERVDS